VSAALTEPSDTAANESPLRSRRLRWNLKRAIELHLRGYTYQDIADKLGVAKSTVCEQMGSVFALLDPDRQQAYEAHRIPILTAVEMRLVGALTDPAKIEKASLNNVAYAMTQVHQARRLEQGQSTANHALHQLVEGLERRRSTPTGGVTPPVAAIDAAQVPVNTDDRV
jgi:hypothetical protein